MSIFNLQSLEEKAKDKKLLLEENKKAKSIKTSFQLSEENVFVTTIRELNEIANSVNANLAYKESLQKEIDEDPTLFKDIMTKFMDIFSGIDTNLREKCLALKASTDILKEQLNKVANDESQVINFKIPCEYTNLGYLKDSEPLKKTIRDQLAMVDANVENLDDILKFRFYIRRCILGDGLYNEPLPKANYITGLYELFRNTSVSYDENGEAHYDGGELYLTKEYLEDELIHTYQLPVYFHHDIMNVYNFLDELYKQEDIHVNDVVTKRVEVILEEYALLYSARADAIVEYTDKIREYIHLFLDQFGGEEDDS